MVTLATEPCHGIIDKLCYPTGKEPEQRYSAMTSTHEQANAANYTPRLENMTRRTRMGGFRLELSP